MLPNSHQWYHRFIAYQDHHLFRRKWLLDPQNRELPALFILNGWMSYIERNLWYAQALHNHVNMFSFDTRGQGQSPKNGPLDAVQNAIDLNVIGVDTYAAYQNHNGGDTGSLFLQGNCVGTLGIAALFAGKFPLSKEVQGTILLSPVNTFNLPRKIKMAYFAPIWLGRFGMKYVAPKIVHKIAPGEESRASREEALNRVQQLIPEVASRQVKQVFWKEDVTKYWKHMDVPSLILVSDNDPLVKLSDSAKAYTQMKYPIWMQLQAPDHLIIEENIHHLKTILPQFMNDPWKFYEYHQHLSPPELQ
jgi:alpha-beta hydrolase superfamily lysophospholipase